ncbi:fimbrial protein [Zobellella sp. DQSA1]|uniref:fimbrial protein n=1 Tax=Zobellella sp. DQSA1 TaxID=3342386 RepID=UPI0035C223CF
MQEQPARPPAGTGRRRGGWRPPLALIPVLLLFPLAAPAGAADNWEVDGANGVLRVHGTLTEGACRLDMGSAYQEVELGATSSARLRRAGERGEPVAFALRLHDCLRGPSRSRDPHGGNLLWDASQPAVSVSFVAPADPDNPALVRVAGVSGLGLRLSDGRGRDVRLGGRGAPALLTPGHNELVYQVAPERTAAALVPGAYRARVEFRLDYD